LEHSSDTPPNDDATERGPIRGLFNSLANMLATIVAIAQTRLELLSTELQQEMHRVAEIMVWTLIALLSAGIGLFLLALVIIFVFWDTHRVLASVAVTGVFFVIAIVAGLVLRAKVRGKPRLLDATLAELAKDRDNLMSRRRGRDE
jgi:uncharacterized membrane protein YqjE